MKAVRLDFTMASKRCALVRATVHRQVNKYADTLDCTGYTGTACWGRVGGGATRGRGKGRHGEEEERGRGVKERERGERER